MPDFAEAQSSPTGSRESVPGSDVGARVAKSGGSRVRVLLGLLGLALAVKLAVFGLTVATSMNLSVPNAENWQDFALAYAPAAQAFKGGFLPYRDFFYPYPPLFLWALTAFSPFPYVSWLTGFPLVAADAATVLPVYLIARQFTSERVSKLVSVLFILAPTNLYYADYLLLNPPLTTLFLMTSVYLLLRRRYGWSALALALSIGFKQTSVIALPVILLLLWRNKGQKGEALKYLLIVAATCLAFSLPYLIVAPTLYIDSVLRLPLSTFGSPHLPPDYYGVGVGAGTRVTFDTSNWLTSRWALLSEGVYSPVTLVLPVFLFLVPSSDLSAYSAPLMADAGWFFLLVGYALALLWMRWKRGVDLAGTPRYLLGALLFVFTLYPLYKYYVVGVLPLLVLLVRTRKDAVGFVAFSLGLMLVPRYFASWVLLVSFTWLFRNEVKLLLSTGVNAIAAPLRSTPTRFHREEQAGVDQGPYWRGHALSTRSWFGIASAAWFLLLMVLVWPHLGFASAFFFISVLLSVAYLAKFGPDALRVNDRNMLWLGMLWGYDMPYMIIASLMFSGVVKL